jgi:hypothetical protein
MRETDRLLVIEMLTVPGEPNPGIAVLDLMMLLYFGEARQRTVAEYSELFARPVWSTPVWSPASAYSGRTTTENRRKWSHHITRSSQFSSERVVRSRNSLNPNVIASALGRSATWGDHLTLTVRKLLILKTERCPSG